MCSVDLCNLHLLMIVNEFDSQYFLRCSTNELSLVNNYMRFKCKDTLTLLLSQIDVSLSKSQRTRQNVFESLLSNNLKIRKESPNSSLEEKEKA